MTFTEFDKKLIEKANRLSRYDYWMIDKIIWLADTAETAEILRNIRWEKKDLVTETV